MFPYHYHITAQCPSLHIIWGLACRERVDVPHISTVFGFLYHSVSNIVPVVIFIWKNSRGRMQIRWKFDKLLPFTVDLMKKCNFWNTCQACLKAWLVNKESGGFLLITNLMHLFMYLFMYSFHLSTCFEHQVLIIRRSNCINTSSGMISLCE